MLDTLFLVGLFGVAFLYASVGHGGASGYLGWMAIHGVEPSLMKPTALTLNCFVSLASFVGYVRAGYLDLKRLWPFILTSMPAAYWGGAMSLNEEWYQLILGVCLLLASMRMFFSVSSITWLSNRFPFHVSLAMPVGFGIGWVSGVIGIGGGVFLSPVLVLMGWATVKEAAAISSAFVFLNSVSALLGSGDFMTVLTQRGDWILVALIGGILGSYFGSARICSRVLLIMLAGVLFFASIKLIFIGLV